MGMSRWEKRDFVDLENLRNERMRKQMNSYIDIHSHILPQIDDGAENFDVSMAMLRLAHADGIGSIILTPHYKPGHHNAGQGKIETLAGKLRQEMGKEGLDIRLYTGNEFYYHEGIFRELEEGRACTMAGSSYVLMEFGPMERFGYIRGGLYEALAHGYKPILAHVERYGSLMGKPDWVEELIQMGTCIQANAGSILGKAGFQAKQFTKRLLKEELVHFVATDAHGIDKRKPELAECGGYIGRKYGEGYADRLLYGNPMHVIKDEYI